MNNLETSSPFYLFLMASSSRRFVGPRPNWWFISPVGFPVLPVLSASSHQNGFMETMSERWLTCPAADCGQIPPGEKPA